MNNHAEPEFDHESGPKRQPGWPRAPLSLREDPLAWSFPVPFLRLFSLRVRVHAIVPLWAGAELVASLPQGNVGPVHKACVVAALLVIALVRELARARLAQWFGSDVDHITIWPVGGLTPVGRPGLRRPVVAEVGGLAANLVLLPALGLAALLAGAQPATLYDFNPLAPGETATTLRSGLAIAVWWAYYANIVILAINLVPMFPLDGARIALAWRLPNLATGTQRARGGATPSRSAHHSATETAARVGLFVALVLFVLAATGQQTRLIALAVFGALATWLEYRRGEFVESADTANRGSEVDSGPPESPTDNVKVQAGLELDSVLAKVSREGLQSLTQAERDVLARETERRRRG